MTVEKDGKRRRQPQKQQCSREERGVSSPPTVNDNNNNDRKNGRLQLPTTQVDYHNMMTIFLVMITKLYGRIDPWRSWRTDNVGNNRDNG